MQYNRKQVGELEPSKMDLSRGCAYESCLVTASPSLSSQSPLSGAGWERSSNSTRQHTQFFVLNTSHFVSASRKGWEFQKASHGQGEGHGCFYPQDQPRGSPGRARQTSMCGSTGTRGRFRKVPISK